MTFAQCVIMITKMAISTYPGKVTHHRHSYLKSVSKTICHHSLKRSIDPVLTLSLIRLESSFIPNLVSKTNDFGLMQVNSKSQFGPTRSKWGRCNLLHIGCNIKWGTRLLWRMRKRCNNNHPWIRHYNWFGNYGKHYLLVLWIKKAYKAAWRGMKEAYVAIRKRDFPKKKSKLKACLNRGDLCLIQSNT